MEDCSVLFPALLKKKERERDKAVKQANKSVIERSMIRCGGDRTAQNQGPIGLESGILGILLTNVTQIF